MQENKYGFVQTSHLEEKNAFVDRTYEKFSHRTGGLAYLLSLVLPQILGGITLVCISAILKENSDPYLFCAYFITQAIMALGLYLAVQNRRKGVLLRMHYNKPIKKYDIWLMLPLSFSLILGLNFLPAIFLAIMQEFGYVMQTVPFPDTTTFIGFIAGFICICVVPAIVEESIFRGVILRSFSNKNAWKGILISSALFALMHGSAQQTVYQFVVGIVLGLVCVKSNSIIPSIVLHMLNNTVSLLFLFVSDDFANAILIYTMLPAFFAVVAFVVYYAKRKTPVYEEVEESLNIQGSVQIKDEHGNVIGMSRDISQNVYFIEKSKKYQGIIFYTSAIVFGVIMWIYMTILGF